MSNPDNFIETATDPENWFHEANGLRRNADVLLDRMQEILDKLEDILDSDNEESEQEERLIRRLNFLDVNSLLLSGLSLENALKGYLMYKNPEDIEISISVDGEGNTKDAKLKEIGGNQINHDLRSLAEISGLLNPEENPILGRETEKEQLLSELEELTHAITWAGRYPVPLKFEERRDLMETMIEGETSFWDLLDHHSKVIMDSALLVRYLTPEEYSTPNDL